MPRISPIYPLPVSMGGTGQVAASDALQSLGGLPKYWTVVDQGTSANDLSSYSGVGAWWGNIKDGPQGNSNHWQEIVMFGDYQVSFYYTGDSIAPACYLRGKVNGVWQPWVRMDDNGIGDLYSAAWTASSSSSNSAVLTNSITLPAGAYVVEMRIPSISTSQFTAGLAGASNIYLTGPGHSSGIHLISLATQTSLYMAAGQSAACTFSNVERGGLRAIRIR